MMRSALLLHSMQMLCSTGSFRADALASSIWSCVCLPHSAARQHLAGLLLHQVAAVLPQLRRNNVSLLLYGLALLRRPAPAPFSTPPECAASSVEARPSSTIGSKRAKVATSIRDGGKSAAGVKMQHMATRQPSPTASGARREQQRLYDDAWVRSLSAQFAERLETKPDALRGVPSQVRAVALA